MKGYTAEIEAKGLYRSQVNIDKNRSNEKYPIRTLLKYNTTANSFSSVKAKSTWGTGNGFYVEATTAGKAGNDINITIEINTIDTLAVSVSGKNILVKLANATASKNTGTLIAAAISAAATGLATSVAIGTGAEQFTTTEKNQNLGFRVTDAGAEAGTNTVGVDTNEKEYMEFNFPKCLITGDFPEASEDNLIEEALKFTAYVDGKCADPQVKQFSTRIFLHNNIASY